MSETKEESFLETKEINEKHMFSETQLNDNNLVKPLEESSDMKIESDFKQIPSNSFSKEQEHKIDGISEVSKSKPGNTDEVPITETDKNLEEFMKTIKSNVESISTEKEEKSKDMTEISEFLTKDNISESLQIKDSETKNISKIETQIETQITSETAEKDGSKSSVLQNQEQQSSRKESTEKIDTIGDKESELASISLNEHLVSSDKAEQAQKDKSSKETKTQSESIEEIANITTDSKPQTDSLKESKTFAKSSSEDRTQKDSNMDESKGETIPSESSHGLKSLDISESIPSGEKTTIIETIVENKDNVKEKQIEDMNVSQIDPKLSENSKTISKEVTDEEMPNTPENEKLVSDSSSVRTNQEIIFDTKTENVKEVSTDLQSSQQKDEIFSHFEEKESKTDLNYSKLEDIKEPGISLISKTKEEQSGSIAETKQIDDRIDDKQMFTEMKAKVSANDNNLVVKALEESSDTNIVSDFTQISSNIVSKESESSDETKIKTNDYNISLDSEPQKQMIEKIEAQKEKKQSITESVEISSDEQIVDVFTEKIEIKTTDDSKGQNNTENLSSNDKEQEHKIDESVNKTKIKSESTEEIANINADTIPEDKAINKAKQSEDLNVSQIDPKFSENLKTISKEVTDEKMLNISESEKLVSDSSSVRTNQEIIFDPQTENIAEVSTDLQSSQQKDIIITQTEEKESKTDLNYSKIEDLKEPQISLVSKNNEEPSGSIVDIKDIDDRIDDKHMSPETKAIVSANDNNLVEKLEESSDTKIVSDFTQISSNNISKESKSSDETKVKSNAFNISLDSEPQKQLIENIVPQKENKKSITESVEISSDKPLIDSVITEKIGTKTTDDTKRKNSTENLSSSVKEQEYKMEEILESSTSRLGIKNEEPIAKTDRKLEESMKTIKSNVESISTEKEEKLKDLTEISEFHTKDNISESLQIKDSETKNISQIETQITSETAEKNVSDSSVLQNKEQKSSRKESTEKIDTIGDKTSELATISLTEHLVLSDKAEQAQKDKSSKETKTQSESIEEITNIKVDSKPQLESFKESQTFAKSSSEDRTQKDSNMDESKGETIPSQSSLQSSHDSKLLNVSESILSGEKTTIIETVSKDKDNKKAKQSEDFNVSQIDPKLSGNTKIIHEITDEKQNKGSKLSESEKLVSDSSSVQTNQEIIFYAKSENVSGDLQSSQQKDEIIAHLEEKESKTDLNYSKLEDIKEHQITIESKTKQEPSRSIAETKVIDDRIGDKNMSPETKAFVSANDNNLVEKLEESSDTKIVSDFTQISSNIIFKESESSDETKVKSNDYKISLDSEPQKQLIENIVPQKEKKKSITESVEISSDNPLIDSVITEKIGTKTTDDSKHEVSSENLPFNSKEQEHKIESLEASKSKLSTKNEEPITETVEKLDESMKTIKSNV